MELPRCCSDNHCWSVGGKTHPERFLYDRFHTADGFHAIGVSHYKGPCPDDCRPYFLSVGFCNIYWDNTFVP